MTINYSLLLITGLRVEYDLHKPNGKRVVRAVARCGECRVPIYELIDPNKSYYVITTVFLATGGDGFKVLKQNYRSEQEMGMFITHFIY
jgi:5'-nucleotidase